MFSLISGDKLVGEASRIVVAEACIQALDIECTCGNAYEINSVEVKMFKLHLLSYSICMIVESKESKPLKDRSD